MDLYRFPKYIYYLTQAMYTQKPMVFIHKHHWTPKYPGQQKNFPINSNCEKVELYCKNEKIGEKYPDYQNYYVVNFENITVKEGTLRAIGKSHGKTVEDRITLSGEPAHLKLTVSHSKLTAGKSDVAIVTADVTDINGIFTCYFTRFDDLLPLVWPETTNMSSPALNDYLGYVDAINPQLIIENGKINIQKEGLVCLPDPGVRMKK